MYSSERFKKFTREQTPVLPGYGQTVYHHVRELKGGGTGIKPPDTHCLPLPNEIHKKVHHYGERTIFDEYGWSEDDVKAGVLENIKCYLETMNIDATKLLIDLLTDYMECNNL